MGKIKKILENELVGGTQTTDVYPVTSVKAVYDGNNERLDHILNRRGVVNISTNYNSDHIAEVLTLSQALSKVPSTDKVLGFQGKYLASDGWHTIIYTGDSLTSWSDKTKWIDLADKVFNSISNNATFAGIATPTTNPGTPDGPVFYLATEVGIYANFNGIEITGEAAILQWNNSTWTKKTTGLATEQEIIYDVSARNDGAVFKSLSALLSSSDLSTLIPTSARHGGMSIRFVQSSDNKYVQARCMAQNFTTDVTLWQEEDDKFKALGFDSVNALDYVVNYYINVGTRKWQNSANLYYGALIPATVFISNKLALIGNGVNEVRYAFLQNNSITDGAVADFCSGYTITASDKDSIIFINNLPADCNYVYVYCKSSGNYVAPYIYGKSENILLLYIFEQLRLLGVEDTSIRQLISELKYNIRGVECSDILKAIPLCGGYLRSSDKLFLSNQKYQGKLINVSNLTSSVLIISGSKVLEARYAFLKDNVLVDNTQPNYCDGYSGVYTVSKDSYKILDIPSDCAYIYVYAYSNGDNVEPILYDNISSNTITNIITELQKNYSIFAKQDMSNMTLTQKIAWALNINACRDFIPTEEVNVKNLQVHDCTLGASAWYRYNSHGLHVVIPVVEGDVYNLSSIGYAGYYGWLTSNYTGNYRNNDPIPYIPGGNRILLSANSNVVVSVPTGAAYLCLSVENGAGTAVEWLCKKGVDNIARVIDNSDKYPTSAAVKNYVDALQGAYRGIESINTKSIPLCGGYINTTKYTANNTYQGKVIPVTMLPSKIVLVSNDNMVRYAFLTSNVLVSGQPAPFCSGYTRYINQVKGNIVIEDLPADCNYLYVYAYSNGNDVEPLIFDYTHNIVRTLLFNNGQYKFRFAHWNIAAFGNYDGNTAGGGTTIDGEHSAEMALRYKTLINTINADVFGVCEYGENFDTDGNKAKDVLFNIYNKQCISGKYGWNYNVLFFKNYPIIKDVCVNFTEPILEGRYYHHVQVIIGGQIVDMVEAHLDYGTFETAVAKRTAQMQTLIDAFSSSSYVIIAADFNTSLGADEFSIFKNAGYTVMNGGYLGDLVTVRRGNPPTPGQLDNICVKGFLMSNLTVYSDSMSEEGVAGGLSDHAAIACDLQMIL